MKLWEVIYRIDEMAFRWKAIIDKLRALQTPINSHALKIIAYPDSEDIPHWRRELIACGNDLAAMQLRELREEHLSRQGFAGPVAMLYRTDGPNEVVRVEGDYRSRQIEARRKAGMRRTSTSVGVDTYRPLIPSAEFARMSA